MRDQPSLVHLDHATASAFRPAAVVRALTPCLDFVVTVFDHDAVLRPVRRPRRKRGIRVAIVEGDAAGQLDDQALNRALDDARLRLRPVAAVLGREGQ